MKDLTAREVEILEDVSKNFTWLSDADQFGKREAWYIMREKPYLGDCEDFALTVLYNIKGRSVFKMLMSMTFLQSKVHYCTAPNGVLHNTLRYKGWYTDNWEYKWCTKESFIKKGYKFHPLWYWSWTAMWKLVAGYFIRRRKEKQNG